MNKKGVFLTFLLIATVFTQVNFKNTCQNSSMIPLLATGVVTLNPMDTFNAGANKDYYQDLSTAKFLPIDVLGYAFAITSFQANCGQNYYSLGVDVVEFQNQNTRMRITVNFRSYSLNIISAWTQASFSYIVVSRTLNGAYSDIWATVAESNPSSTTINNNGIDKISSQFGGSTANSCQMYVDPSMSIDLAGCASGSVANGAVGGTTIIHAYIMGFQWNPSKSATDLLYVSVLKADGVTSPNSDSAGWVIVYASSSNGPQVKITNQGGALEWIKVGFVYSRYDAHAIQTNVVSNLIYSSAYVFEQVTVFNAAVPITNKIGTTGYNSNYFVPPDRLPDARYAIYGLSSFELPVVGAKNCSQISVSATLNNLNTYTISTPNASPKFFTFQADIFTVNKDVLCVSQVPTVPTVYNIVTVGKKDFFTIPTQSIDQNVLETADPNPVNNDLPAANAPQGKPLTLIHSANSNGNNDTVTFRTIIPYIGLTVGVPTKFEFGFWESNTKPFVDSTKINVLLQVNGLTIYQTTYTTTNAQDVVAGIVKGLNINSVTAEVSITIQIPRSVVQSQQLYTFITVSTFISAYDPTTGCCVSSCPTQTGLDVTDAPPVCVYCDTSAGLFYNPANGTCTCQSGYYLLQSTTFQCFPCSALYCAICNPANPAQCTTCVPGGVLNTLTQTCVCGAGYFINGTVCQICPYNCQTCNSPSGSCSTCVDPTRRDSAQNCKCISGYFDPGSVNCTICSPTCLTCSNAQTCTSCDASKFRNLTGTVCSCQNGYYELTYDNLTRACQKCNPECLTCSVSPSACLTCDPSKNRVSGVDSLGNPTCLCQSGFYSTPDGSCIQSNCNADPFCSQCEQGLQLCIQCLASKYRVIKLPEARCVCMDGYYADASNNCVPCQSGCGICSSKSNCTSCVALSISNGDGSCSCPPKTYFAISIDGVRYCSNCGPYCNACVNSTTCTTCAPSYTKTADNQCVCSARNFVDARGNCVPCASGCSVCTSAANCTQCLTPLVLQGTACQANCNNGFTVTGSVCLGCPTGCLQCTQNFVCFYCADNYYLYKGSCYDVCPAGTIGDKSTGNWLCIPCNSPCQTCINHPSFCTSCQPGKGYLVTSAIDQSCVPSCNDGTFALNGVCQVCDFSCATCLGSASNCISCPVGQLLYQGGCWANCPAVLLSNSASCGSTIGSCCVDKCPDGFYKISQSSCAPCSPQCTTCQGGMDNCTSCLQGSVSLNGTCVIKCGENQFNFRGICLACSPSCYGCSNFPTNCITCASGYVQSGSLCQKGCLSSQYYDYTLQRCVNCDASCATCSSINYCLTCTNVASTPRGGICSSCPYPCSTCEQFGKCTSCLSGFNMFQGQCQKTCPSGASSVMGVCRCISGIISNGQCVVSCPSGFTPINGACISCNSNCAQCSGNVNTCTKCLTGFSIDPSSNACISANQCPYGQQFIYGGCASICDNGFYYLEGACLYGTCANSSTNSFVPNAYGGCIRNTADVSISLGSCSPGTFSLNNKCVSSCGTGFYPDQRTSSCLPCSDGCASCFNFNYCVICLSSYTNSDGFCAKGTICTQNQLQYGTSCVTSCPAGNYQTGTTCQRICPPRTYYMTQICYSTCPTNIRTSDACVQSCPPGSINKQGVCG